ncbi:RidA family protein [Sinorhizobium meliloti]|uniref:RidA family protein n=1 Tax=Rhizobium meliloti TaxID=382 RepID=UPI0009B62555|nr:RidA family protein [Sinorhizobium meliloti]MDE3761435.1 RidA family protein [Sinorhizobium meliloti]
MSNQSALTPVNTSAGKLSFSQGMILKGGGTFVSSGHVGLDEKGELVTSSLEDQVVAVFESLRRTLNAAGLGFEHVARISYYVTDLDAEIMQIIRKVRCAYLSTDHPPASTAIGISVLPDAGARVEVEVVAVVP